MRSRKPLGRRQFLTLVGGVAVGLMPGRARAARVGANDKVRLGVVGTGGMGGRHVEALAANDQCTLVALCDCGMGRYMPNLDKVEQIAGKRPDGYQDFRKVLERDDIDAIFVATPDHWHPLLAILGCQAGKDVYVEKPLGRCIDEGRAMVEAAAANKRIVQMGTQWHSGEHYREAIEFVHSGQLGKIRMVRCWAYLNWLGGVGHPPDGPAPAGVDYDMWLGPAPKRAFNPNRFHFNFRWFWDYAGGLMTDWGVHLLNIALWGMGPEWPTRVCSMGAKHVLDDNSETPDTQVAVYDFPKYTLIFEHQIQGGIGPNGKEHGMLFSGSEGTLTIDGDGWRVQVEEKRKKIEAVSKPAGPDARPAHVRNFLDCVKSRQQPVENLEVGHHVSTVAHLGNLAYRTKTEIHWDSKKERAEGNKAANALVECRYRKPWKLPYSRS